MSSPGRHPLERHRWARGLLLVALPLVAALVAGCAQGGETTGVLTGDEAIEEARHAALNWSEDAELIIASGIEAPQDHPATQRRPDDGRGAAADDDIGDGRSPQWTVLFYSEDANTTRSFVVAQGEVEALEEAEPPGQEPEPMAKWQVDSPEAVSAAMNDDEFRSTALASQASVALTLGMLEGGPIWSITTQAPGEPQVLVQVDAIEGEILSGDQDDHDQPGQD